MSYQWIWLPTAVYPSHQKTKFDAFSDPSNETYVVAEFQKDYAFSQKIASVSVLFSADTEIQLFCNGKAIATGPSAVGGDFFGNGHAREWYYANEVTFSPESDRLCFFARVKMCPVRICEYSKGKGGFMLSADLLLEDGSHVTLSTDRTWQVRKNGAYAEVFRYDGRILPDPFVYAEEIPDVWEATLAPIPVRTEREISAGTVTLAPHEKCTKVFELDKIYAAFLHIRTKGSGNVHAALSLQEIDEHRSKKEKAVICANGEYRGFFLHSIGKIVAEFENESNAPATVDMGVITTCYPVSVDASTVTSDAELNDVLAVAKHTLQYCRQTHHLDSPLHAEPLACTGDYYIEALMTAFSFGDLRLAAFDLERTANLLRYNDGRMFHTTYSLIWVRMLYDVYLLTGDKALLSRCRDALDLLLARFASYVGENGLVEDPPDFMFVDWIYIDGLSMHHPPKALGQTVLNLFYFMALGSAEKIYRLLGDELCALSCGEKKNAVQNAVNTHLYDSEKKMYFEGLNTPTPDALLGKWMPQNVEKRYYLKQSNILAVYTSVCDGERAKDLIERIMTDEIEGDVQPYFLHYLLEAVYTHGLREKYTRTLLDRWKPAVKACKKGLAEGFYPPEPTYSFDHSHAWGGTPLYALPKALTGITVTEAGYKKVSFSPCLLGFEEAKVEIPTPFGMIVCALKQGEEPRITLPDGIAAE